MFFRDTKAFIFITVGKLISLEPNLPMTNLKRETIMCVTQTLFQAKLSEVLYEDSSSIGKKTAFFDSNQNLIDGLQFQQKKIQQEVGDHPL